MYTRYKEKMTFVSCPTPIVPPQGQPHLPVSCVTLQVYAMHLQAYVPYPFLQEWSHAINTILYLIFSVNNIS